VHNRKTRFNWIFYLFTSYYKMLKTSVVCDVYVPVAQFFSFCFLCLVYLVVLHSADYGE